MLSSNLACHSPDSPHGHSAGGDPATESAMLSAWTDDHLTPSQLEWKRAEHAMLARFIGSDMRVIDIGSGDSRVLNALAPEASYIGIDIDQDSILSAQRQWPESQFPKRRFVCGEFAATLPEVLPEHLSGQRTQDQPDLVMCIGNTFSAFEPDRVAALSAMLRFADVALVSVCRNAPEVILKRIEYYAKNKIDCTINWSTGSIHSTTWGESRSLTAEALLDLATKAGAEEGGFRAEIVPVGEMGLALILDRRPKVA